MKFLFYHLYLARLQIIEESLDARDFSKVKDLYRRIKTDLILDISGSASFIKSLEKLPDGFKKEIFGVLNVLLMAFVTDDQRLFSEAETPFGIVRSKISRITEVLDFDSGKETEFFSRTSDLIFELEHLTDFELAKRPTETTPDQIIKKSSEILKTVQG
ncbi:MAG: hypothetical protein UX26_C0006G0010 [Parcubacteria group bacterium GW2011_GWC1_45_9]|uniref:Uncharacterized protein n=1 Tax=Candidatus Woesebacteria bacterium GW2011_GWB1_39_12 TaxID=1618574 RepID=A0A0G0PL72_9BACT|nr:MAG: hypothetical protein UT24_C0032G0009 [Candidatus Woesebacteria bacterium GW2011_GWB1_39_12]KKU17161.1 MAG: hypothetical protein UX26_C0006G0010 [Parcubacteria group bacterium GW2011_GWC1_45_9]HCI05600.1 hypothetical protein [Patescibacteria group bacterium]